MFNASDESSKQRCEATPVLASARKSENSPVAVLRKLGFNRRCPMFFKILLESLRFLMAQNPHYTGRVVITVHCKDGSPEMVAVDTPDVPKSWKEVLAD